MCSTRPVRLLSAGALASILVAVFSIVAAHYALAQAPYPPPGAFSAICAVSPLTPVAGTSVTVTTTVLDADGQPVEGAQAIFTIVSQPGNDATIDPPSAVTDPTGTATATLSVGSTAGTIVVRSGAGDALCQATVGVSEVAGIVVMPQLPATGSGTVARDGGWNWLPIGVGALLVVLAGAYGLGIHRRRDDKELRS